MQNNNESTLEKQLSYKPKCCWEVWDSKTKKKCFNFAEDYKEFVSAAKTERLAVKAGKELGLRHGYSDFKDFERSGRKLSPGEKIFASNRGKTLVLVHRGKKPITEGMRLVMAHVDSPRLDFKLRPLYEDNGLALFATHYYGGIKKYQWPALPLALYGVIVKKDGTWAELRLGDEPNDPVFMVSDLLPHLADKQLDKKLKEAIEAEKMNLVVGNNPFLDSDEAKEKVKLNILNILNQKYDIKEEDLISAELEAVPVGSARDLGFDRSLISAYGHDDRVCAYPALTALLDQNNIPEHTLLVVFYDKEETGSRSNTGATSLFLYDLIGRLLDLDPERENGKFDYQIRKALRNSEAISADVTAGINPSYKEVHDEKNAAKLGYGVALQRYTGKKGKRGTSEATAEYTAKIRALFDQAEVMWQPAMMGKVDIGGGGTIAVFVAEYNLDIIDIGVPLLNMHAPFEIASKADIYSAHQAYSAFLNS
ncbi:MAG: aminopeptidase [Patescibacteria group bacterium]|nr:aminopeptidase [Patescibacteria group bacterium]